MIKKIFLLIFASLFLRIIFIPQGVVSFHYDMARDAFEAREIWQDHNLKIMGPSTTTAGLNSGVLYYYLLAIPYGISYGDPKVAAIFLSLLNSLAIIPLFLLTKDIFKSEKWALVSSILYATSFEAIQYGPWLSNPSPGIFTVAMFFYSLRLWQKGNKWGLPLSVFFASLSAQLELFLSFLLVVILIFKFVFNLKVKIKDLFLSIAIMFATLSTFFIAMIKFQNFNQVFGGFLSISQNTEFSFRIKFTELLLNYIDRFANLFINNFFPVNVFVGGILGFIVLVTLIFSFKKDSHKFILFCLLCNLLIFFFGGQNAAYTTVGMVIPAILGIIVLLQNIFKKSKTFAVSLIILMVIANLYMIFKLGPKGQVVFVIPKDMVLNSQLKLIDTTYKLADGKQFSINSLTLPFWTNTTWAYLYWWYGLKKYGYVPSFYGRDQIGLLGSDSLEKIDKPKDISFFIIEPHEGITASLYDSEIETENSKTKLVEEINYGSLKLQVRTPLYEK